MISHNCRRILTQKEMQEARSELGFCYICGEALPPRGPGFRKQVTGEHVVPRGLLGDTPEHNPWTVELDVHPGCEQTNKQGVDALLNWLQKIQIDPVSDWPEKGHLRNMGLKPVILQSSDGIVSLPAFGEAEHLLDGVWAWIRGLHAALYQECLPRNSDHFLLPPVPACGPESGLSLPEAERYSATVREVIRLSAASDKWDGMNAWGSRVQYRCVWVYAPEERVGPLWRCFWSLLYPDVLKWSATVLKPGFERPWHGHYVTKFRPANAAFLTGEDFPGSRTNR